MLFELLTLLFLVVAIVFIVLYVLKYINQNIVTASASLTPTPTTDNYTPSGNGYTVVNLNKEKKEINVSIYIDTIGSPITMAHIHDSKEDGTIGKPVLDLFGQDNGESITNDFLLKNQSFSSSKLIGTLQGKSIYDFKSLLEKGQLWVNVHTEKAPSGELQGKLEIL